MNKRLTIVLFLLIVSISAFLRFYKINQLPYFQYDQARDALYTKRLIVDHKLRLIGPQASPGFYTGPAYYYLMAPFLAVSKLDPSGMDFGVAVYGVFTSILIFIFIYWLTKNNIAAFIASFLFSISPDVVTLNRISWNPNITPFFFMVSVLGCLMIIKKIPIGFAIMLAAIGIMVNLHFTAVCLLPWPFIVGWLYRKKLNKKYLILGIVGLVITLFPYLLIDLRHSFINTKTILTLLIKGQSEIMPMSPLPVRIGDYFQYLFLRTPLGLISSSIFWKLVAVFLFALSLLKPSKNRIYIICTVIPFILFLLSTVIYRGNFHFYYLTFMLPIGFLVLGWLINSNRLLALIIIATMIFQFKSTVLGLLPIYSQQSSKTELLATARAVSLLVDNNSFNIVGVRGGVRHDHNAVDYRYFLETYNNKKSYDWDVEDYEKAEKLIVVDTLGGLDPISSNIWEIVLFDPIKIEKQVVNYNNTIYLLMRN